ncbi:MAG: hypothetical protein HY535_02810 [Chloroflexi bacterium]|nr:hypothetical protein [Chloroflexota bacterium]
MPNRPQRAAYPSDLSPEDIRRLAHGLALQIPDDDLAVVTYRFNALMEEFNKLLSVELDEADPLAIFHDAGGRAP